MKLKVYKIDDKAVVINEMWVQCSCGSVHRLNHWAYLLNFETHVRKPAHSKRAKTKSGKDEVIPENESDPEVAVARELLAAAQAHVAECSKQYTALDTRREAYLEDKKVAPPDSKAALELLIATTKPAWDEAWKNLTAARQAVADLKPKKAAANPSLHFLRAPNSCRSVGAPSSSGAEKSAK